MIRKLLGIGTLSFLLAAACFHLSFADNAKQAILLEITGAIGPATQDYIQRGIQYAHDHEASLIILRMDTPGGLDTSMRGINQAILASTVPVVTYVAPSGARAASAGTYILYASHLAAMAPGTNLGAAHPVSLSDETLKTNSVREKKATNDAAAYIRSLAQLRNRNIAWAENAVRKAASFSANEALKHRVIDVVAESIPDLLQNINGKTVIVAGNLQTVDTANLTIEPVKTSWRYDFLSIMTNPSVAYILLLIGIYGLFFEFSNPGMIMPGVLGGIAMLIALYAFQLLPINYAGFSLLLLGIAFMIAEMFISSFGVLGIGGVIAFVVGSILLFDTHLPGFNIAWQLIVSMGMLTAGFFFAVVNLTIQSWRKKIVSGQEALLNKEGEVLDFSPTHLTVRIDGEIWNACSKHKLKLGQKIRITQVSGLLLTVEPVID